LRSVVQEAYNIAVSRTFLLAVATGGLAFLCALGIEWKNIKGPVKKDRFVSTVSKEEKESAVSS
jgi:hypothetical protein